MISHPYRMRAVSEPQMHNAHSPESCPIIVLALVLGSSQLQIT